MQHAKINAFKDDNTKQIMTTNRSAKGIALLNNNYLFVMS